MAKKRTKAQKKLTKVRVHQQVINAEVKPTVKKSFIEENNQYILTDLKKTIFYTVLIMAVLLTIFVYTKTS
ncbi:MAG: hypothetical protein IT416_03995 [Candidatus Pacebacteria bacterium]|nr:hypothetical protein [Candidatus Paceibacterota bacterium]